MPSFRRRASVTDADKTEEPVKKIDDAGEVDALALAEEAEAEAAEAEAMAAAARARARAIRLRREAAAAAEATNGAAVEAEDEPAPVEEESADALAAESATTDDDITAVTEDAADTEDADIEAEAETAPSGRRWGLIVKIAACTLGVLLTAALVAASGYIVWQHRKSTDEQRMSAEYAAAGRQSVVTLMSLDFNKAKEDVQRIIDNATGQFKTDFQNQAEDFIKVAQDSKVTTDVTVNASAVESMTKDTAVVLVSATSRVTNSAGAKQEPRAWRLSVNLQRDGGQIKMSKVEFVP